MKAPEDGSGKPVGWVTVTFNSGSDHEFTITHPSGYRLLTMDEFYKLNAARELLSDLDRNENGRHKGDSDFGDPSGVSHGNPLLPPGTHVGYSLDGARHIVVPDRPDKAKAWYEEVPDA